MIDTAVARRYAKGLFQAVQGARGATVDPAVVAGEIDGLAAVIAANAELRRMLVNPAIEASDKAAVLKEIARRGGAGELTARFLDVLADNERIGEIESVARAFRRLVDEHVGIIDARVTTPKTLEQGDIESLRQRLESATGRTVRLTAETDPELLGGLVTRIGDVVYDGSLRHHLGRIRDRMMKS